MSDQPKNPSSDKPGLILDARNRDVADVVGDYLGGETLVDAFIADSLESRSASKALLQQPPLSESQYGEPQRWKRGKFSASEYRNSLVKCSEDRMKFNDDPVNNRRRYNNASLKVKVIYKERLAALDRALVNESLTARCTAGPGGHMEPEDHSVDAIAVGLAACREIREEGAFRDVITTKPKEEGEE